MEEIAGIMNTLGIFLKRRRNRMGIIKVNPIIIYPPCLNLGITQDCHLCSWFSATKDCDSPRSMCVREYPNHKKGCPNYGKKEGCPPSAPMFDSVYDLSKPIFAIYNVFNFKRHVKRMRDKHPDWSKRQLECCLYWQNGARKELRKKIELFQSAFKGITGKEHIITIVPEAMGVNVTETMKKVGIEIEWPPVNIAFQIAFGGIRKEKK